MEGLEAVNLAREAAGAVVCSQAVSYSETPLSNILAGLDWMAETFMKPPVSVTLHLAVPVKLSRLEWRTRVGRQFSLHHEVQVSTDLTALARPGGCHCGQAVAVAYCTQFGSWMPESPEHFTCGVGVYLQPSTS